MKLSRRSLLTSTLFGAGYVGLRALASGVPASVLLRGPRALGDTVACPDPSKAQFIILNTSGQGDPLNANAPGTYEDPAIVHPADPTMAATPLMVGGTKTTAAMPWSTLPQDVLDRTTFWHVMTDTPVHPKEPDVLKLQGAVAMGEMLPSVLAKQLAPCLQTVQTQPITIGATSPSEGLSFNGQALPIIPPLALKQTLTSPTGPLTNLQQLRDQTLAQLDDLYRQSASKAQAAYLDSLITSQTQVRNIKQDLLDTLSSITDNSVDSQITAAIALIQMNVTPVVVIHIPFGGDNHSDPALARETTETVAGVASIGQLMAQLSSAGLADRVTFLSLNVFGRTIGPGNTDGRQHNQYHQLSLAIGKPFKGGIIGGVAPRGGDYGALPIDPSTGAGGQDAPIAAEDSLASFGKTAMAAVGVDPTAIDSSITSGQVVTAALA